MEGKIPGHEALLRTARAITGAQLGRMSEKERDELGIELMLQVAARRDDIIPDSARAEVVTEVIRAATVLYDHLDNDYLVDFALTNLGLEGIQEALSVLDEPWVIFTCGNPICGCVNVCTRSMFDRVAASAQKSVVDELGIVGAIFGSLGFPPAYVPRIIWEKSTPEPPDGGEKTDPLEEDESCPACGGSGSKKDFCIPPG